MKRKNREKNIESSLADILALNQLISYTEAAKMLSLGKRTLEKLVAEGSISYIKVGRRVLFDPNKLRAEILEIYGVNKTESWNSLK